MQQESWTKPKRSIKPTAVWTSDLFSANTNSTNPQSEKCIEFSRD